MCSKRQYDLGFMLRIKGEVREQVVSKGGRGQAVSRFQGGIVEMEVREESITTLEEYSSIPIAFVVQSVFDVRAADDGPCGFLLAERNLDAPYVKDYDAIDEDRPSQWAKRFDTTNWGLLVARVEGRRIGGAVVAFSTPGLDMLEGREDLAVLWDIRVSPDARGRRIGSALFRASETWAISKGCSQLKVETQNNNVAACRLYERQGCLLKAVNRMAYAEFPDELEFLWYKDLSDKMPFD